MWTVYGIKNCDTMKKTFALFDALGVPYTFHDYKKQGIDAATLARFFDALGEDRVLNRSGTTWRKLDAESQERAKTRPNAIALCVAQPSVIRRPIVEGNGRIVCGYAEPELRALLGERV